MFLSDKQIEKSPLVSIVICTYNRENYIKHTIDSILNQKRDFPIEILVGDDASIDNTRSILLDYKAQYPLLFTLFFHEVNQGIGKNWAYLMKQVNGKYIALCDDDDYWHNDIKLKLQVEILEKDNSIGLIHTDYRYKSQKSKRFFDIKNNNINSKNVFLELFTGKYSILTSSVMLRHSLIQEYVDLDDYINYDFPIQDWETWMLIAKYTKFYHLPISTVSYHFSTDSVTRVENLEKLKFKCEREKQMYKYICDKFPEDLIFDEQHYDKHVRKILFKYAFNANDFKLAKENRVVIDKKDKRFLFTKNNTLFNFYQITKKIKNFIQH